MPSWGGGTDLSPMQRTWHHHRLKAQHSLLRTGHCTCCLTTAAAAACPQRPMSQSCPSAISLQLATGAPSFLWSFSQSVPAGSAATVQVWSPSSMGLLAQCMQVDLDL